MVQRLVQIAAAPFDSRYSKSLINAAGMRSARGGGWRILFYVNEEAAQIDVTEIERRGQVYRRL